MKSIAKFIKKLFGRDEAEKQKEYFIVLSTSKYRMEGETPETYASHIFADRMDAERHFVDIEQFNESFTPFAIVSFKSDNEDITCAKLNYTRCEGHPNPTVTFGYKQ